MSRPGEGISAVRKSLAKQAAAAGIIKVPPVDTNADEGVVLRPQPGPQEDFLATPADIAIYGGSAFSGKTFGLLLEPLRHKDNKLFATVCFRRETTQVRNPGGLWDESMRLYPLFGAKPREGVLEYDFPSGAVIKFAHLEHENSVMSWDGAQFPLLMFDQLEHFSRAQFFYMLSRNRDPSGTVRPYVRATCNPNADSWLAEFIAWWIDQDSGFPLQDRAGKIRWLMRQDDTLVWGNSREELVEQFGPSAMTDAKSVTFIPGTIFDNKIGMQRDPSYLGTLRALNRVERERLLMGNWKIRAAAGLLFRREWCRAVEVPPTNLDGTVRYWDLAATPKTEANNPAWTVGIKLGRYRGTRRYVILDVRRMRESSHKVEQAMLNTAILDGKGVRIGIPQDPGQAGKSQVSALVSLLSGFDVRAEAETGDKVVRFGPFSAQCEAGNVDYVVAPWNDAFLSSLENFPDGAVKDDADSSSGAFRTLLTYGGTIDFGASQDDGPRSVVEEAGSPWAMNA